jgi:hypothetical protein
MLDMSPLWGFLGLFGALKNDRCRSKKARTFVAFLKIIDLEYGLFNTNRAVQCRT